MKIVNKVIKFKTRFPYNLIKELYPKHTEYTHKPRMLKFKDGENTIIIFKSLKGRIMGPSNELNLKFPIENVELSTMTITHEFNFFIDLENTNFIYLPELFAAGYQRFPEYCNIFHNGKLIILGVKSIDRANQLIDIIYNQISNSIII